MPITFNVLTNRFEGENEAGEILEGFDFSVFGGLITNNGTIDGPVFAISDESIEIDNEVGAVISKAPGSPFAIDLRGNGGRNVFNDGTVFGETRLGTGWDSFINSGLIEGKVETAGGNDQIINQIIPDGAGGLTVGTITGGVFTGTGNDTVVNAGIMANVILGGGDDVYNAVALSGSGLLSDGIAASVSGQSGNDQLIGGSANDKFFGGSGNDQLIGNDGRDQLFGQSGNDFILAGAGNDLVNGGAGGDYIDGGTGNDDLSGASGDDIIFAGVGNDKVNGGNDDDLIYGDDGNDSLIGGAGNDTISGGAGRDTMIGGNGADEFIFAGNTGKDIIRDFSSEDRITINLPLFGLEGYSQILFHTEFIGANAVIDLSGLYNEVLGGPTIFHGSEITIENVSIADLTPEAFGILPDILVVG